VVKDGSRSFEQGGATNFFDINGRLVSILACLLPHSSLTFQSWRSPAFVGRIFSSDDASDKCARTRIHWSLQIQGRWKEQLYAQPLSDETADETIRVV
jgi:hypothetical protein